MRGEDGTTRIRVGIVGAGAERGWARAAHIPALRTLDAFEIRGVSTTRLESARATADEFGIALAFDDHRDLVSRDEIDLVVVAVKVPEHRRIVSDALDAGKMVFCEWPLAASLADAETLAASANVKRLRTMVGLQGRLHPPIRYLRDIVRDGAIGTPLSTSVRAHPIEPMWAGHFDPPFEFMARGANGATMLSIALGHALEPLARVLGEFDSLSAVLANRRGDGRRVQDGAPLSKDTPDEIAVAGVLDGGIVASLHYSAGVPAGHPMVWEIQGSEGSLIVTSDTAGYMHLGDLSIVLRRGNGRAARLAIPPEYLEGDEGLSVGAAGVARLYRAFAADLASGGRSVPEFGTALARHRVLDAISKAAETGERQVPRASPRC